MKGTLTLLAALLPVPLAALCATGTIATASVLPPTHRGLYAIWYERMPEVMGLPYITGAQVVAQWGELETVEGQYDFSQLEAQMKRLHDQHRPFTVQVNGNKKPAWLFGRVPCLPEPLSVQVRDARGTLMYWHPVFERAYGDFLRAYAAFLKQSPYRTSLLGVRQNFNAIGTEHWRVPNDKLAPSQWRVPPGAKAGEPFTPALGHTYQTRVLAAFVKEFAPDIRVFVRNSIEPDLHRSFEQDFKKGRLCWFHTSSEMEPRKGVSGQYGQFLADCRTGKTLAYAEPWASAWGDHGGKSDPRWCSPPQWNYWRLLCDLHCGVSFIACYANDLEVARSGRYRAGKGPVAETAGFKDEFDAAFRFAAKYAGYHASPQVSPGAWVAFREGDALTGDYTFLMQRQPDHTREVKKAGPDDQRFGAWARLLPRDQTVQLVLDDTFAASLATQTAELRVTYLDRGTGSFDMQAAGRAFHVQGSDSGRWKTIAWELSHPVFEKDDASAHLRLRALGADLILHMVEVARK
ncbi:MAG: hypothetical protein NTY53_04185 [Kiritimatiellaeota bacterium]|nr:hypothetical protein [Kiritimatiellota bacterium]